MYFAAPGSNLVLIVNFTSLSWFLYLSPYIHQPDPFPLMNDCPVTVLYISEEHALLRQKKLLILSVTGILKSPISGYGRFLAVNKAFQAYSKPSPTAH